MELAEYMLLGEDLESIRRIAPKGQKPFIAEEMDKPPHKEVYELQLSAWSRAVVEVSVYEDTGFPTPFEPERWEPLSGDKLHRLADSGEAFLGELSMFLLVSMGLRESGLDPVGESKTFNCEDVYEGK